MCLVCKGRAISKGWKKKGEKKRAEILEKIKNLRSKGLTTRQITTKLRNKSVRYYLDRYLPILADRPGKGSTRKMSEATLAKILQLSKEGLGIETIGKEVSVDASLVRYWLIKRLGNTYSVRHSVDRCGGPRYKYTVNLRGDRIQSILEGKVADVLFNNDIVYKMHTCLHIGNRRFFPDFYLPDSNKYIEVLGMMGWDVYKARAELKKRAYRRAKIRIAYLYKENDIDVGFIRWAKRKR